MDIESLTSTKWVLKLITIFHNNDVSAIQSELPKLEQLLSVAEEPEVFGNSMLNTMSKAHLITDAAIYYVQNTNYLDENLRNDFLLRAEGENLYTKGDKDSSIRYVGKVIQEIKRNPRICHSTIGRAIDICLLYGEYDLIEELKDVVELYDEER